MFVEKKFLYSSTVKQLVVVNKVLKKGFEGFGFNFQETPLEISFLPNRYETKNYMISSARPMFSPSKGFQAPDTIY